MGYQDRHRRRMERRANRQERRDQRADNRENNQDRKREKYTDRKEYVFDRRIDKTEARAVRRANRSQRPDYRKLKRREADEALPLTGDELERDQLLEAGARVYLEREELRDELEEVRRRLSETDNKIDKDIIRQELKAVEMQLDRVDQEFRSLEVEFNLKRQEWKRTRNWKGRYRKMDYEELVLQEYVDEAYNANMDLHDYDTFGTRHDGIDYNAPYRRAARVNVNDPTSVAYALKQSGRSPSDLAAGDPVAVYALGLQPGSLSDEDLGGIAASSNEAYEAIRDMKRAQKEIMQAGSVPSKLGNIAERLTDFIKKPEGMMAAGGLALAAFLAWKNKDSIPKPIRQVMSFFGWGAVIAGGAYAVDKTVQHVNPQYRGAFESIFGAAGNPDTFLNSENLSRVRGMFPPEVQDECTSALLTGNMKVKDMIACSRKALRVNDPKYVEKDFTYDIMSLSPHINTAEYKKMHGPRVMDYFRHFAEFAAKRVGLRRESFPSDDAYMEAGLKQLEGWGGSQSLFSVWAHLQVGNSPARAEEMSQHTPEEYRGNTELQILVAEAGMGDLDMWPNGTGRVSVDGWSYDVQETKHGYIFSSSIEGADGEYKGDFLMPGYENGQMADPEKTLEVARQLKSRSREFMKREVEKQFGDQMNTKDFDFSRSVHAWVISPPLLVDEQTFQVEIVNPSGEKLELRARAQNGEIVTSSGGNAVRSTFGGFGPLGNACKGYAKRKAEEAKKRADEEAKKAAEPGLWDRGVEQAESLGERFNKWMDDWPIKEGMGREVTALPSEDYDKVMEYSRESLNDAYEVARRVQVGIGPVSAAFGRYSSFLQLLEQSRLDNVKDIMKTPGLTLREAQGKIDDEVRAAVEESNTVAGYSGPYKLSSAMKTLMPSVTANKPEAERIYREQIQEEAKEAREKVLDRVDELSEKYDLESADLDRMFKKSAEMRLDKIIAAGQIDKLDVFEAFLSAEASQAWGLIVEAKKHGGDLDDNGSYLGQLASWLVLQVPQVGGNLVARLIRFFSEGSEFDKAVGVVNTTFDTHWNGGAATSADATAYVTALGPAIKNSLDLTREW